MDEFCFQKTNIKNFNTLRERMTNQLGATIASLEEALNGEKVK
jgi:hypothetical protein